jgi:transcriptional regulator
MSGSLEILQGTLDVLVLKSLIWGPRHGYAVARWINETSRDTLLVEDRALYVALHRLEDKGFLAAEWGVSDANRKAKYYSLTPKGRRHLRAQDAQWRRYAEAVFRVLDSARAEPA